MDNIPTQRKRLMMDPTEFWSSQFASLRPSTPAPSAVNRRSSSVDLDDPLLSASPSQLNAPEKNESRQPRLAVVLKSPKRSHQYSWSEADSNGHERNTSAPPKANRQNTTTGASNGTGINAEANANTSSPAKVANQVILSGICSRGDIIKTSKVNSNTFT
ncbi:hypothetical protein MKX08_005341 [Trichoderma sp. CBMAI-0020]|nr:hypothetical protein MKX08_005341 [Trichoderma sp. CBMAI-0020]